VDRQEQFIVDNKQQEREIDRQKQSTTRERSTGNNNNNKHVDRHVDCDREQTKEDKL
jgi:hypothetical protein